MIQARDYFGTAAYLLVGQPPEGHIRRAISTAYYAVFHHLCLQFAEIVERPSPAAFSRAWDSAYRYVDHGPAKQRCKEVKADARGFPQELIDFATAFVRLQERRIDADYNPSAVLSLAEATSLVLIAEQAIIDFDRAPNDHRRAFVVFLGLRPKGR
jgi:hypothetical protein